MVALSVDIKEYIHIVGQRVLRGFHVVAEARVVRGGMLLVEHRRVMAHPAGLVRAYFHDGEASLSSSLFCYLSRSLSLSVRVCLYFFFCPPPPLHFCLCWRAHMQTGARRRTLGFLSASFSGTKKSPRKTISSARKRVTQNHTRLQTKPKRHSSCWGGEEELKEGKGEIESPCFSGLNPQVPRRRPITWRAEEETL